MSGLSKIMIKVTLNNKETELEENLTVDKLLESLNNKRAAVWINGRQLLKTEYNLKVIMQGDEVKVLRIMAGG